MGDFEHDLIFRNARIHDGVGSPSRLGEVGVADGRITAVGRAAVHQDTTQAAPVGVADGRITAVGPRIRGKARRIINLEGLSLAPGFIDSHTHDDRAVLTGPDMTAKVSQGVTTVVTGNCGISLAPLDPGCDIPPPMNLLGARPEFRFPTMASYADALRRCPPAVNVVALVGHMTLRLAAMRDLSKPADGDEISAMRSVLAASMREGASGLSTGLFYSPNAAAGMNEVTGVTSVLSGYGGIYTTHMRCEGDRVMESIEESALSARRSGVPLLISHHKCAGRQNWGRSVETLGRIRELRRRQTIHVDVYPYAAGSTVLSPQQVREGIRIIVTRSENRPECAGRDLSHIADEWGVSRHDAVRALEPAGAIYFQMDEADVRRILSAEFAIIGSDGLPHDSHPHPRLWGTFPRVAGRYARDAGLFSIDEAVRKMTGLAAEVFGLVGRGRIAVGCAADLVVFDARTVIDHATFENPEAPSGGIHSVYVNGIETFVGGRVTARAGRLLRGCPAQA